ncbi:hypothetical protein [Paucilactobacillus sp. N302-9]
MTVLNKYQIPEIKTSQLNTLVYFYSQNSNGPEPGTHKGDELFHCLALAYDPSSKDQVVLDAHSVTEGLTIKIPDPLGDYIPSTSDLVEIQDYRYQNSDKTFKQWNIVEVAHDFENNRFVKIILGRDGS